MSLAEGRGHAVFFDHHGLSLVLKHYQRGGQMAMLLGDRYIGSSCDRSRSFREWRLLRQMHALGLPVPQPAAASCTRHGLFYRADHFSLARGGVPVLLIMGIAGGSNLVEGGRARKNEIVHAWSSGREPIPARIVSPVFYDPKSERQHD